MREEKRYHPLAVVREGHNLTQKRLAEVVRIGERTVTRAENNKPISAESRRRLCEYFGMTAEQLGLKGESGDSTEPQITKEEEATKNLAAQLAARDRRISPPDSLTSPFSLTNGQNRVASSLPLTNQLIEVDRELGESKFLGKLPPALSGRDALHLFVPFSPLSSYVTKQVSFDQETLKAYQSLLPAYWEAYYMSSRAITLDEIDVIIQDLGRMIVYGGNAHQQTEIQELLCQYHQFALDLARDQGNFERALYHAHLTLLLATQTGNNELLAACLYRRGLTYFDMGDLSTAANDLRDALPFACLARPQLQGMVTMEAARFQAHLEPGEKEKVLQIDQLLDQTQCLVENGPLEDDTGHVKLDKGRYHIGRAATLLALKRSTTAREELDEAARLIKQEHRRRHAYITILRARTYFVEGDFDYAANLALDAATSCIAIQSKSNLADLTRFYASLTQTSFKYAPTTVQLGVILRTQK